MDSSEAIGFLEVVLNAPWYSQIFMLLFLSGIAVLALKAFSIWKKSKETVGDLEKFTASISEVTDQIKIYNQDFPKYNGQITDMQKDMIKIADAQENMVNRMDKMEEGMNKRFDDGTKEMKAINDRVTNFMIEQAGKGN
jgi:Na+/phosphate symporter